MLLHVHKGFTDDIDMVEVANLFVSTCSGNFLKNVMPIKSAFASEATQTV